LALRPDHFIHVAISGHVTAPCSARIFRKCPDPTPKGKLGT
jgi:hypothetical protein